MIYDELVYWNKKSYGNSITIPLRLLYGIVAVCIPIVVPLPLAIIIPKKIVYRYC